MQTRRVFWRAGFVLLLLPMVRVFGWQENNAPLPDIHQLLREAQAHQKQLDKIRESYTYSSLQTRQDIDPSGQRRSDHFAMPENQPVCE